MFSTLLSFQTKIDTIKLRYIWILQSRSPKWKQYNKKLYKYIYIDKYITNYEPSNNALTRAAVFFDIKNLFNNISRTEFFNAIELSFPQNSSHSPRNYSMTAQAESIRNNWIHLAHPWDGRRIHTWLPTVSHLCISRCCTPTKTNWHQPKNVQQQDSR